MFVKVFHLQYFQSQIYIFKPIAVTDAEGNLRPLPASFAPAPSKSPSRPLKSKTRGGSKRGVRKKHLQEAKAANDPTLLVKGDKRYSTLGAMDEYLMKLSKDGVVFWINEYLDEAFKITNTRSKTSAAWRFCRKAKYALKRNSRGVITKYDTCSWKRCQCIWCDYICTCDSATTIQNHIRNCHIFDAQGLNEADQKLFCRATGIPMEQLNQDPETIEAQEEMNSLIAKYKIDTKDYKYGNLKPQSLKNQPQAIQKKFQQYLIELLVGVNATPSSANKRVVARFIDVCTSILYDKLYLCQ